MADEITVEELELTDAELIEVLKNHGLSRRILIKALGVGGAMAALGGTGTARPGRGKGARIDEIYGDTYSAEHHTVPEGLVDHGVELHIHEGEGDHAGFPMVDSPEDDDFKPDTEGPETFFDPVGLHVKPGEIVKFTVHGTGLHTVTSFDPKFNEPPFLLLPDRVPTDHGFTSPPLAEDDTWLYKFTTKGVYDLFCLPHVPLGMVIRIVVYDPEEDDLNSETFDEPDSDPNAPLPPAAAAVLNDSKLDPADIVASGEVAWSDLTHP